MRLAIQLYTLRNLDEPLTATLQRLADTPYEGVQFAGLDGATTAELADALDDAGLDVAGAHVGLEDLETDPGGTVATYDALGCDQLVVPSYEREAFESDAGAREAGRRLSSLADALDADDAGLHYHNHTFEFTPLDDGTAFDAFAAAADGVGLEIDTGLASHAGVDPVALLERYGDRVSLVHLTDSRAGEEDALHVDPGEGEVDVPACVEAAGDAGADWIIFEHGLTDDPLRSMERAAETLSPLL